MSDGRVQTSHRRDAGVVAVRRDIRRITPARFAASATPLITLTQTTDELHPALGRNLSPRPTPTQTPHASQRTTSTTTPQEINTLSHTHESHPIALYTFSDPTPLAPITSD